MMEWAWIPIVYLLLSVGFGVQEARHGLAQDLKNSTKGWYPGDGSPKRTEEERIRFLASQNFWPGIGYGLLWPLAVLATGVGHVWDFASGVIASKEIKAARKRAADAKTKEILDRMRKEEEDQFKDL